MSKVNSHVEDSNQMTEMTELNKKKLDEKKSLDEKSSVNNNDIIISKQQRIVYENSSILEYTEGKFFSHLLYSTLFAAGLAMRSFILVILFGEFSIDAKKILREHQKYMWPYVVVVNFLVIFAIYSLFGLKKKYQKDHESDQITEIQLKSRTDSIGIIVDWGLTFVLAEINFAAIQSVFPIDQNNVAIEVIYVLLIILLFAIISGITNGSIFSNTLGQICITLGTYRKNVGSAVFSGSAWTIAAMWTELIQTLFGLESINTKGKTIHYLWFYNVVYFCTIVVLGVLFKYLLYQQKESLVDVLKNKDLADQGHTILDDFHDLKTTWYKLFLQSSFFAGIGTLNAAVYATVLRALFPDRPVSINESLPLDTSVVYFLTIILICSFSTMSFDKAAEVTRIPDTDGHFSMRNIQGILEYFSHQLHDFFFYTLCTGITFLIGAGFHQMAWSIFDFIASKWFTTTDKQSKTILTFFYILFLICISAYTSLNYIPKTNEKKKAIKDKPRRKGIKDKP